MRYTWTENWECLQPCPRCCLEASCLQYLPGFNTYHSLCFVHDDVDVLILWEIPYDF
ncbi:hypothetical protein BDP81DRAFT_440116 [Colletotrichum phormii]|uniref:Uncharacterized protein n=1 Tax=Colletotrichum phormii TaxID=359342 RepID=A0AAJ0E8N6_9PEZI|nr:uncharacterized protein BDP81DRAFT_440116 [Colletotrichum phormii]KAK1623054.1 hypothetical protein BDP81DRAFT_440116 [Colletotrichum phormii]